MKSPRFTEKSIPFAFAIVTILSYGLLLPLIGFYWDDWPFAWIAKFLGPKEFIPAFARFRPFLGPIFYVTTSLIPPVPLYWQILALVIRFISGFSFWFTLNQIFPTLKRQTLVVSLLFLVFPGYSQHWVALTHINQEWIPFIFYLLSFGFSARAIRNQLVPAWSAGRAGQGPSRDDATKQSRILRARLLWEERPRTVVIIAILLLIAGVFPTEYFIGLEPLRFIFIWVILAEEVKDFKDRFVRSLKHWWPYLLVWLANAAWLFYYYKFGAYDSYGVGTTQAPLSIGNLFPAMLDGLWKAGFYIWGQILVLLVQSITAPTSLLTLALILFSFFFLSLYLLNHTFTQTSTSRFALQAIFIGSIGILLGRVPTVAAGLPLTLQSSYDRFMVSMMIGGSLFITGLTELIFRNERVKPFVFALLIALGIGQQFFNANIFRRDWANQREIYWQMAWRMPSIKTNTVLLTHQMPIDYETDMSFTAPINWMFAPNYDGDNLPYLLLYTEKRLGGNVLPDVKPGIDINFPYRTVEFHGNTSQAIVVYMPPNGCLRVLDPALGDVEAYEKQSRFLTDFIPLSKPSLITNHGSASPPFIKEPVHTWCYYYAKAELARQLNQWPQIVALGQEAKSKGYIPEDAFEWLPFIEANAMSGNIGKAEELSLKAAAQEKGIRKGLCQVWKRIHAQAPEGSETEPRVAGMLSSLQCDP